MKTSDVALLDVSVLIALLDGGHADHDVAHDWFADNADEGWATCPITENGVVRILSNASRVDDPISLPSLFDMLRRLRARGRHQFWPDDVSLSDPERFDADAIRGHQQITDVYLLALAVNRGGRFVTLDQRVPLAAVKGATRKSLEVISAS